MSDKEKKAVNAEAKTEKSAKEKKNSKFKAFFAKLKDAWRGFNSERKKIVWPTWKQVWKNTLVVLVVVGACAVMIAALDTVFHEGIVNLPVLIEKIKG